MDRTTRIYRNTSKDKLVIPGIAELKPGEQVSITAEFQPPIVLENFSGLEVLQ